MKGGALGIGLAVAAALGLLLGGEKSSKAAPSTGPSPRPGGGGPGSGTGAPTGSGAPTDGPGGPVADVYAAIGDPRPGSRTLRVESPLMRGGDVEEWQHVLQAFRTGALPQFGADGAYGDETRTATQAFQREANGFYARVGLADRLVVDGVAGPLTRTAAARRAHELEIAPFAPAALRGDSPLPGSVPAMDPVPTAPPEMQLASALALNLLGSRPGTEDKTLVRQFQAAEGLTASGHYNVQTALRLMAYGIVPPTPFYWGKTGVRNRKRRYRSRLEQQADRDPVRAPEWLGAARQVS